MILCGTLTLETVKTVLKFVSLTRMPDLPLAHVMEHRASKGEFYSGESEYSGENSGDEESADNSDEEMDDGEEEWSEEIRRRPDINFDNDACGINVNTGN